jgi:hypothetical protein
MEHQSDAKSLLLKAIEIAVSQSEKYGTAPENIDKISSAVRDYFELI